MAPGFRASMTGVHTWTGLLFGWVLYFVFVTGTLGYFDTEIDRWMQPELPKTQFQTANLEQTEQALAYLSQQSANAKSWWLDFPVDRNKPFFEFWWQDAEGEWHNQKLDKELKLLEARDTGGGQLLYRMHWKFHYMPRIVSDILIGIVTLVMLLALITGIIIHKNIFKDFFSFKAANTKRAWLEGHKVTSVLSLPFHLMITYSGLVFMMFIYFPWVIASFYGAGEDNRQMFLNDVSNNPQTIKRTSIFSTPVDIEIIWTQMQNINSTHKISVIEYKNINDLSGQIILHGSIAESLVRASEKWVFNATTGELIEYIPKNTSPAKAVRDVLLGLHEGLFADGFLRWLYFLAGILGSAMIASGLILWSKQRKQKKIQQYGRPQPGLVLVEKLNIATIIGLISAIGLYFVANRLLPLDMMHRAEWEAHVMFIGWGLLFVHASLRTYHQAWLEQLGFAALVFLSLPFWSILFTDRPFWLSWTQQDWVFVVTEALFVLVGIVCLMLAWRLRKRRDSV